MHKGTGAQKKKRKKKEEKKKKNEKKKVQRKIGAKIDLFFRVVGGGSDVRVAYTRGPRLKGFDFFLAFRFVCPFRLKFA